MSTESRTAPIALSREDGAAPRFDSWLAALLYVLLALGAGRVFRFGFDDEIYTLRLAQLPKTPSDLFSFAVTTFDVHPQLSYLFYSLLRMAGVDDEGQRAISLAISAAAVAIVHRTLVETVALDTAGRLVAIILFATTPLLVTHGDALRYIPLFTLFFALFLRDFLRSERLTARGAIFLGLMLSTNLLGAVVALCAALASVRERGLRATLADGLSCGPFFLLPGAFGLRTLAALPQIWSRGQSSNFEAPGLGSLMRSALGFFGGYDLGLLQSPGVVPFAAVTVFALWLALTRRRFHFVVLLYASALALGIAGFSTSRAFAFVQLAGTAVIVWALTASRDRAWYAPVVATLLCCQIFAFLPLRGNERPFKRNLAIPYASLIASVEASAIGHTTVVVIDPTASWEIERRLGDHVCISHMRGRRRCPSEEVDTLIVISGHHSKRDLESAVADRLEQAYGEFAAPAVSVFGVDAEASLKNRISGSDFDPAILKMHVFHRK